MNKTRTNPKTKDNKKVIEGEISEVKTKQKKDTSIVKKEENNPMVNDQSVEAMITLAIKEKTPVETLERLLAMRRELKQEWAKAQFDKAMAAFQSECPVITKETGVPTKSGAIAYKYAKIESIVSQVKSLLEKHGFSYSTQTETGEKNVKATCLAKHKDGHSEPSSMEVPLGNKTQIMSDTQVVAAAITYAKRYAFLNAFGILTGDEDNDAKPTEDNAENNQKDVKNYVDLIKMEMIRKGAKNMAQAVEMFNDMTGMTITEIPKINGPETKEMYESMICSPTYGQK